MNSPYQLIRLPGVLLMVLILVLVPVKAQTTDFAALEQVIGEQMAAQQAPGLAIAITKGDQIIYVKGFGVRNTETNDPVTPSTVFRIGSTTKPLTVVAMMQLVEAGKVNLDERVVTYIPEFAAGDAITVRHLLSHTAGMGDLATLYGSLDPEALREYVASLTQEGVFAEPGLVFSYSNPGFNTAGVVIEQVTGKHYADYMGEKVFPLLGMTRTTLYSNIAMTYPFAVGYNPTQTGIPDVVRPNPDNISEYPSGYVFSSVEDMAQFAIFLNQEGMLDERQVVDKALIQEMATPAIVIEKEQKSYGLGLDIREKWGTTVIEHGGDIAGYTSEFYTIPSEDLRIVILANSTGFSAEPIFEAALTSLTDLKPVEAPLPPVLSEEMMSEYVGTYIGKDVRGNVFFDLNIQVEDGNLMASGTGLPPVELIPVRPDLFELSVGRTFTIIFTRDPEGAITFASVASRAAVRQ